METIMIKNYFFRDMGVMLVRSMRHVFRSLDTIIIVTIMPIAMMLLFVYILGGAIKTGTDNYMNYLLPGILLIAVANSVYSRLFTLALIWIAAITGLAAKSVDGAGVIAYPVHFVPILFQHFR